MEIQKVLIKSAYCLVGLSIVVLIALTIFQHQQIKKLSRDVTSETVTEDETSGEAIPGPVETLQKSTTQKTTTASKEIDELEYQLDAAEEELDMAQEQLTDELAKKAELKETATELQKKALSNPATQKMIRASAEAMIDMRFGQFFDMLELSPEKTEEFKEILVNRNMETVDISPLILGASSEEEKAVAQQRLDDNRDEYDKKFNEFLGEEKYETFQIYHDSLPERYYLSGFMESLSSENRINEDQVEVLIQSMHEARKEVYAETGYDDKKIVFPSDLNKDKMEYIIEVTSQVNERYMEVSRDILPSAQVDQFKDFLKQQLDISESSMKISAQVYGGKSAQKSTVDKTE
jgi:hypothetical protein